LFYQSDQPGLSPIACGGLACLAAIAARLSHGLHGLNQVRLTKPGNRHHL